ncbi:protein ntm1-like 9 [Fagus crenata]
MYHNIPPNLGDIAAKWEHIPPKPWPLRFQTGLWPLNNSVVGTWVVVTLLPTTLQIEYCTVSSVYDVDEHRTALVFLLRESYYKCEASSSAGAVNHFYIYNELSYCSELVQGFAAATNMEYDFVVVKSVYSVPDPELQRHLDMLYEPQFEPQFEPRDWTLLSPIHAQMQAELGSLGIYFPAHNDFNGGNNGVQFPHGSNEPDEISEFLESALCNPEECSYDEFHNQNNLAYDGQTSMKTEVVNELLQAEEIIDRKPHLQMETTPLQNPISSGGGAEQIYDSSLKGSNNHLSAFASGEVRNGFSITPRQRQKQPSNENSMTQMAQGTAPRRLRSHCKLKLQVRPLTTSLMSEDCSYTTEDHESKPVATEEEKASEKDAVASGHGAAAIALSERRKILSDSTENCKTPQEPNASMRPSFKLQRNKRNKVHACQNVFLFSKAPPVRHSNWPLTLLFRVVVIAVLFIIFASIWRCLKF